MTTVKHPEFVCTSNFTGESITTGAMDTPVPLESNKGTDIAPAVYPLGIFHFGFTAAEFKRIILEHAFTGLVANRAIERMIDEKVFHHQFLGIFDLFIHRFHLHSFDGIHRATGLKFWCRPSITHVDDIHHAHPACGHDRHSRMITIMGDLDSGTHGGRKNFLSRFEFYRFPIQFKRRHVLAKVPMCFQAAACV